MPNKSIANPLLSPSTGLSIASALTLALAVIIACMGMPTPAHLFALSTILLISVTASTRDAVLGAACIAAYFIIVLNWLLTSTGIVLFKWDNVFIPAYAKVIAFACFAIVIYKKSNKNQILKIAVRPDIILFLLLVLFSLLQSGGNYAVATSYIGNVFLPLAVSIVITKYCLTNRIENMSDIKTYVDSSLAIVIFFNLLFLILFYSNIYDIHEFVSISGAILRNPGAEALDFKTVLMGIRMGRFSGLFPDPIISGYFWAAAVLYFFLRSRKTTASALAIVFIIFLLLTLSKGSALVLLLGASFIIINKYFKSSHKIRFSLIISQSVFVTVFMVWWGLREGTTDSSAVHVLGLIMPFMKSVDFYYIVGNGLGTAGNLGGWVAEGAESFYGLVQYSMGILGTIIIVFWWGAITWRCTQSSSVTSNAILGLIVPLFVTGALQENVFNLPYVFPRLLFVALLAGTEHLRHFDRHSNQSS